MGLQQFRLPDLGEGLAEGDILRWTVAVGDTVEVNDTIVEVETVKAAVELPSPFAGRVAALHAGEGETVPVGTPIISIETADSALADAPAAPADGVRGPAGASGSELVPDVTDAPLTLVGYGPRTEDGTRRRRRPRPLQADGPSPVAPAVGTPAPRSNAPMSAVPAAAVSSRVLAKPPVRMLAKTLGVDLATLAGTGPLGSISRDDVHGAAVSTAASTALSTTAGDIGDSANADRGARETRVPIRGVRKHTAAAVVASAFTAPHVTEFLTVDMSQTMQLRERVVQRREFADVKVSPLLFVAKAVLLAVRAVPEVNAVWDDAAGEIVHKHYVNLGIAAATPRGLTVPNIKDADRLSLLGLAEAMVALTATARAGRTTPADLAGGTFTITNIGVFGVDAGTPILNPGESAILAFGAVRRMPWVVGSGPDERIEPRWVTQLALSFDHRIVDGEQGSKFLAAVGTILTDPAMALL